ncbi:MerR family transcriptional regulator [Priestia megaterium]|uniref:MerR family transcriptional regulator n=1 Tax=Priestia megaterium TaxID=1404 RepID=UPI000BFA6C9B|nr:MerR family transcriptional regulator [Priestia megaterium]MCM3151391.1 MerR family transcriptional regulator [Priestia megaterium]PFW51576.1 MerR family transcriptional regulator [Priestia megaterium]
MSYTMRDMQEKTGLSAPTLRYYEKEGILPFVEGNEHDHRLYNDQNIEWVKFILALRATGMPLVEIKQYVVESYKKGESTISERRNMMLQHKKKVEADMSQTYLHLERINYKLALYDTLEAGLNNKQIKI